MNNFDLTADSTKAELRAAAERYAANTYEQPDAVLARLQDAQWELRGLADPNPGLPAPTLTVTPWSEDVDLMEVLDELETAYPGIDGRVLAGMLRDLRWHLREAVASTLMTEAIAVVSNMGHLIHADTTDSELAAYADAAEAGSGGPIDGLLEELIVLRGAERVNRRFVAGAGAPRIVNLGAEG